MDSFSGSIHADGGIHDKPTSPVFHQITDGDSNLFREISATKHPRTHTGIIVIRRGPDHRHGMPQTKNSVEMHQGEEVGMTSSDKNKMLLHQTIYSILEVA